MTGSMSTAPTIPAVFDDVVERTPDAPFLVTNERTWTYREVADAADSLARSLNTIRVSRGDRIAIAAPNGPEWILTLIAATRLSATVVALNVLYRERELDFMLNESGASVLICSDRTRDFDFARFLERFRNRLPGVKHFVFLGDGGFSTSRTWNHLITAAPKTKQQWAPVHPMTPAFLLYTSGTTGAPKGAMLTHASILASARAQAQHLGHTADDAFLAHMPMNHVGGLTCTVVAALTIGARLILVPEFHPQHSLEAMLTHRATVCLGVPTMYQLMMAHPKFADSDRSAVGTCVVGGANLEPALGARVAEAFPTARLANLYGLSETSGGAVISGTGDDLDTLITTLGVPVGDTEVRVIDGDGHDVAPGDDGELLISGSITAAGYWQRPDATAATFGDDGWVRTGDIVAQRDDGHLVLRGRRKEMYVRGGYSVYPAEIENLLTSHLHVTAAAVIGIPDYSFGEAGLAYVSVDEPVDVEELYELCRTKLAPYKQPEEITILDRLPTTPTGKINKSELRRRHAVPVRL